MINNELEKLDLTLYSEKLSNGLEVYIVPKSNVNGVYVTFSTKYGSNITEFVPRGQISMKDFPLGIAHFLEHKMFENEDMKDPFTFYSEHGCDANANTSNLKTTYLFSGPNFLEENINFLLDYVQKPYFTDENVEKEKGIIEQEIKMYDDDPYSRLYQGLLKNIFHVHPYRYKISGEVEDIKKITKEYLYTCYETFYHPSNMFMVVTGACDPKEVMETIKINQSNKKFSKPEEIKIKKYDEPNTVLKDHEEIDMNVEIPKLGIAYKFNFPNSKRNINDIKTYIGMLFNIKLGPTSEFNERLKQENLITYDIDTSIIGTDKHVVAMISVETKEPNKVKEEIFNELKDLNIEEADFNRKLKTRKSSCIYGSDSIYSINNKIMSNIINYNEVILDDYEKIDSFKYKTLQTIIKKLKLDNKTVYQINKP